MKVKTSRLYYLPLYLLGIFFLIFFPTIISLVLFFFLIVVIEIYITTHYLLIKNKDIYIFQGIINKKIIKLERSLLASISLERDPYLYLLNLYTLKIKSFDKEYKIKGIKNGEKIFKLLTKSSKIPEHS